MKPDSEYLRLITSLRRMIEREKFEQLSAADKALFAALNDAQREQQHLRETWTRSA